MAFKRESGNWTRYRKLPSVVEVDFHFAGAGRTPGMFGYWDAMAQVRQTALESLKAAQEAGNGHVLFTHGSSTSRPGRTTARSEIRRLMRSPEATPYIIRRECIQHDSVFVAAMKPAELVKLAPGGTEGVDVG